jgi:hypothetical protein
MARLLSRSFADPSDTGFLRAMGATIDRAAVLDAMTDDRTLAVCAAQLRPGRHRMDRTFEAVECHRLPACVMRKALS